MDELRGLDNDMQCPTRADNAIRTSEVLDSIRNGGRTYTMDGVVKAEWNVTYKRIVMPGEGYTGGNKPTNGYEIVTGIYDCKPYTIYRGTNIITSMVSCIPYQLTTSMVRCITYQLTNTVRARGGRHVKFSAKGCCF